MSLHDQLERLADTAPRPGIDHAVWERGRALRRRDRLVTSAVVVVMVLVVGGLASLVLGPPRAVAPANETVPAGAIPRQIYDVPADADPPLETDLAIGQGSVAFVSSSGLPIVVGASDGAYHSLELPHWGADSVLAISPSGDRLAWLSERGPAGAPALRVLTLRTGEIGTGGGSHDAALRPTAVSWSPNGNALAWLGEQPGGSLYGIRLREGGLPSTRVVSSDKDGLVGVAVADDGRLALGTGSGGILLEARKEGTRKIAGSDGTPASFSPSGSVLALETRIPSPDSSTLEVATGKQWRHPFPAGTLAPATTRPLGWLDDRQQLVLAQESFDEDAELIVTTPKVGQNSTWRRRVGSVDPGAATTLSIAVDLIPGLDGTSSQQLTHDFGEPAWLGERDISWMIGLGAAGVLSVLYALRWLWRRRTPRV